MAPGATDQEAATSTEPDGTVFYLVPENDMADKAVDNHNNPQIPVVTRNGIRALRIALGCSRTNNTLVRLGTHDTDDIVLLGKEKASRCHFCFHQESGELLLKDVSRGLRTLLEVGKKTIMEAKQSQCTVVLRPHAGPRNAPRVYSLKIGLVKFTLFPADKSAYIPLSAKSGCSSTAGGLSSWPGPGATICYTLLYSIFDHVVSLVVIDSTGEHAIYKRCCQRQQYPPKSEEEWRKTTLKQLDITEKACKETHYIVPWHHYQYSDFDIEIFMPVYQCSLEDIVNNGCFQNEKNAVHLMAHVLHNISHALHCLHTRHNFLHRDVKPGNILYSNGSFYLADFDIGKVINDTNTIVGSEYFISPEVKLNQTVENTTGPKTPRQTAAMDIYSLGLTAAACLLLENMEQLYGKNIQDWHREAEDKFTSLGNQLGPSWKLMLRRDENDRCTASQVHSDMLDYLGREHFATGVLHVCQCMAGTETARPAWPPAPGLHDTVPSPANSPEPNSSSDAAGLTLPTPGPSPSNLGESSDPLISIKSEDVTDDMVWDTATSWSLTPNRSRSQSHVGTAQTRRSARLALSQNITPTSLVRASPISSASDRPSRTRRR